MTYDDTKLWVDAVIDSLGECLNSNYKITLSGLGTFLHKRRKERVMESNFLFDGGITYNIPERWALKFLPSGNIKRVVTTDEARELGMKLPSQENECE